VSIGFALSRYRALHFRQAHNDS